VPGKYSNPDSGALVKKRYADRQAELAAADAEFCLRIARHATKWNVGTGTNVEPNVGKAAAEIAEAEVEVKAVVKYAETGQGVELFARTVVLKDVVNVGVELPGGTCFGRQVSSIWYCPFACTPKKSKLPTRAAPPPNCNWACAAKLKKASRQTVRVYRRIRIRGMG